MLVPSKAVVAHTWNIGVFNFGNQTVNFDVTYLLNRTSLVVTCVTCWELTQIKLSADHAVTVNRQFEFVLAPGELHFANAAASADFVIQSSSLLRVEAQFNTIGGDLLQQSGLSNLLSFIFGSFQFFFVN